MEVRHRLASWRAETEELGPRGCALVSPRVVPVGRRVELAFEVPGVGRVRARGRVIWARPEPPARLGLALEPRPSDRDGFERLLAAHPPLAPAVRDHLAPSATLHLGLPPRLVVDFTPDELAVLERVGDGVAVEQLLRDVGGSDRVRGAVFALLERRHLALAPVDGGGRAAWAAVLAQARRDGRPGAPARAGSPRPAAAQRLYDDGLAHLAAGRLALAVRRFEEALALAPGDAAIGAQVRRLARWA